MRLRPLKFLVMAGAGWTALAAVPAVGAPCDQQLQQVREHLTRSQLSGAERRSYQALFHAARAMQQNGDEQVCIEIVNRTQELLQQRAGVSAVTRPAAVDSEARAAQYAVLKQADPFAQIARFERIRDLEVVNSKGEDLGRIVDLVVDFGDHQVKYALLSMSSGLLGDNKLYPVPVDALKLGDDPDSGSEMAIATNAAPSTADVAPAAGNGAGSPPQPAAGMAVQAGPPDGTAKLGALAQMTVGELVGNEVKNDRGDSIGSVEAVILPPGAARIEAVLSVGGWLGIGDKSVAIALDRLTTSEDGLRFKTPVTEDELKRLPKVEISDQDRLADDTVIAEAAPMPPATGASAPAAPSGGAQPKPSASTTPPAGEPPTAQKTGPGPATSGPSAVAASADRSPPGDPLANKVLVLDIDRATLEQAPGFTEDAYPDLADAEWHRTVLAFYENVLHLDKGAAKTKPD